MLGVRVYPPLPLNRALYDVNSYEHVGEWDEKKERIIDIELESEE